MFFDYLIEIEIELNYSNFFLKKTPSVRKSKRVDTYSNSSQFKEVEELKIRLKT